MWLTKLNHRRIDHGVKLSPPSHFYGASIVPKEGIFCLFIFLLTIIMRLSLSLSLSMRRLQNAV